MLLVVSFLASSRGLFTVRHIHVNGTVTGILQVLEQDSGLDLGGAALRFLGSAVSTPQVGTGLAAAWLGPPPPVGLAEVGGTVDLELYWQRLGPLPEELILYAGLEAGTMGAWAQTDERPLGSLLRADAWPEGEVIPMAVNN